MRTVLWRTAVSIFMFLSASVPFGAHAGVLSSIFAALATTVEYNAASNYTSQTMPLLEAARNTDPNPAKGGGDIIIVNDSALLPTGGPTGAAADIAGGTVHHMQGASSISLYVVRPGDSLGSIAAMFDVSINTIRWANDISRTGTIHPGQELVILPVTGIKYTVKTGGTLRDIIKKYGGDVDEAADYNGIGPDDELAAGTEVIVPQAELIEPKAVVKVAATRSATRSGTNYGSLEAAGGPVIAGYFMRPITGGTRTQGIHGYNAVDLAARIGTPVMAAASGTVIVAKHSGYNGGYGEYVVISHDNGTQTLYAHASDVYVNVGDRVVQGQAIMAMGSSGRSTGSHVHFEIRGAANPF